MNRILLKKGLEHRSIEVSGRGSQCYMALPYDVLGGTTWKPPSAYYLHNACTLKSKLEIETETNVYGVPSSSSNCIVLCRGTPACLSAPTP